jgi:hypothetical protein
MQLTKFSLITLLALVGTVFCQVDDNGIPRPGDDRVPGVPPPVVPPPVVPVVPSPTGTVDDHGHNHTGIDDRGHNSTTTQTSSPVPVNSGVKNSIGALGIISVFALFI